MKWTQKIRHSFYFRQIKTLNTKPQITVDLEFYMQWYPDKGTRTCSLKIKSLTHSICWFHGIVFPTLPVSSCQHEAAEHCIGKRSTAKVGSCELRNKRHKLLLRQKCVEQMIILLDRILKNLRESQLRQ